MSDEERERFVCMGQLIAAESEAIAALLEPHGVARHAALLAARGVTRATLPELTVSSFVGISGLLVAERRKLVAAARALCAEAEVAMGAEST